MFEGAALAYARHRPDLPDAPVRLLADTLRGRLSPVLLDLGDGTGQVPLALLTAGADLTHIEPVDVSPQMLHQTRQALTPVLGHCTLTLVHAAADAHFHCGSSRNPSPSPFTLGFDAGSCGIQTLSAMAVSSTRRGALFVRRVASCCATPRLGGYGSIGSGLGEGG